MTEIIEQWEERLKKLKKSAGRRYDDTSKNKMLIAMCYELDRCIFMAKNGRAPTVQDIKNEIAAMGGPGWK